MKSNESMRKKLTQKRLKELVSYDKQTGEFILRKTRQGINVDSSPGWYNWCGYLLMTIDQTTYRAHHLAWLYVYGTLPSKHIDHINGDKKDNRICNLREVTHLENMRNQKRRSDNSVGITGVSIFCQNGKWRAFINTDGKQIHLGYYDDFFEACCARKSAESLYGFHRNHGRATA